MAMKGQVWAFLAVMGGAAWAGLAGVHTRSSDPNTIQESINMGYSDIPNIPFGDPPGGEQDVYGSPLDPDDFAVSDQIAHDPVDYPQGADPILGEYFGGDIILPNKEAFLRLTEDTRQSRNMIKDEYLKWPNGIVYYVVSDSYNKAQRKIIAQAMTEIQSHTCILFVPRETEKNYIHIYQSSGCSSSVGMQGGKQAVSLDPRCVHVGVVIHELLHALGFWHEHSRYDRDSKIRILTHNIKAGLEYNFKALSKSTIQTMGVPYDTGSIMHYGTNAFAKSSNLDTIRPLDPYVKIGQRTALSSLDKMKINKLYCQDAPTTTATVKPSPAPAPVTTSGSCGNNNADCDAWATKGECLKNPSYMLTQCCRACKKNTACTDGNKNCQAWARGHECTKNPGYMTTVCAKSCGMCLSSSESSLPGKGGGGGGPIACIDENVHCTTWSKQRQCEDNPKYMLVKCKRACNSC